MPPSAPPRSIPSRPCRNEAPHPTLGLRGWWRPLPRAGGGEGRGERGWDQPMSVTVRTSSLHKTYRDGVRRVEVLRGIDMAVEPGELVAVVGPSGSGKSTLLHLLGGLDRPDSGTVEVAGQLLSALSGARMAEFRNRTIGFVFQFHQLLPDFTALENVMLPGRIAGLQPAEVYDSARRLLVEVGLEERLEHFPNQLSGGERQRVALCR